jgi:hypothetical protein
MFFLDQRDEVFIFDCFDRQGDLCLPRDCDETKISFQLKLGSFSVRKEVNGANVRAGLKLKTQLSFLSDR